MNFFQRRKILKETNLLDLTPFRKYDYETTDDGLINILIPKFKNEIAKKFIMPRVNSPFIKVKLDIIGSDVWVLSDGKHKISDIMDQIKIKHGNTETHLDERLSKYYSNLYMQGFISFNEINK